MAARLRCAIYTRKSSEEGLEQSFNSLHAQREACEAYVLSQAGEGWGAVKTLYDDGGFSGGSMERPALRTLLADIDAGLVDVVVVYKVDRLTRSLADFAKIVEAFDRRNVSFVSVTQAFNTTTSMGRLTLNVLLSFAQFEREVTGERIRDKIAASKAKGMWMGGTVPLGYDLTDRSLVVNSEEAAVVRRIYDRYLALGSARAVVEELDRTGVRTKRRVTRAGKHLGGERFGRGGVLHVLQNRLYLGEIIHKGVSHPGLHAPIISHEQFEAVATAIAQRASEPGRRGARAARSPLIGKIFDPDGQLMTPTFSYGRKGRLYRYYASGDGNGRRPSPEAVHRVSAPAIEGLLHAEVMRLLSRHESLEVLATSIRRVELRDVDTLLTFTLSAIGASLHPDLALSDLEGRLVDGEQLYRAADEVTVLLPKRLRLRGGGRSIIDVAGAPARRQAANVLAATLRRARELAIEHRVAPGAQDAGPAIAPPTKYLRELVIFSFLAPELQRRVMAGGGPATGSSLMDGSMPLAWADQVRWFDARSASRG